MAPREASILARDVDPDNLPDGWVIDDDGVARPWWYSRTGYIVKWSVFFGLVTVVGLYLLLGYLHAKRRLRKGLVPLRYHRVRLSFRSVSFSSSLYPAMLFTHFRGTSTRQDELTQRS